MPSMYEIYEKHSYEYDELVSREDYRGNVQKFLKNGIGFTGKTVMEFGTGTGRLTAMYAEKADKIYCYDRSEHMLEQAKINLVDFKDKIEYGICDNTMIAGIEQRVDIVIEGWSFGHTASDNAEGIERTVDSLIENCRKLIKPGGSIILFESLGTDTPQAIAPTAALKEYYNLLEQKYSFERTILETDYKFSSNEEAERITGFFFGDDFQQKLSFKNVGIVKEFTGVWHLSL